MAVNQSTQMCSTAGCAKRVLARGICAMHYQRAMKDGSLDRVPYRYQTSSGDQTAFVPGQCAFCKAALTGRRRRYCDSTCNNRAFNARRRTDGRAAEMSANRRALEKGAKVSRARRFAVLEADNYICHLCELPTDSNVEYPHPDYPVVDHVVPLSLGGDHDPSNWRCAHNSCNSKRGNMTVEAFKGLLALDV